MQVYYSAAATNTLTHGTATATAWAVVAAARWLRGAPPPPAGSFLRFFDPELRINARDVDDDDAAAPSKLSIHRWNAEKALL